MAVEEDASAATTITTITTTTTTTTTTVTPRGGTRVEEPQQRQARAQLVDEVRVGREGP